MLERRGSRAFIGRNYTHMEAQEREEEYLEQFKEMALEPEEKSAGFASELFMAHSQQAPGSFA